MLAAPTLSLLCQSSTLAQILTFDTLHAPTNSQALAASSHGQADKALFFVLG